TYLSYYRDANTLDTITQYRDSQGRLVVKFYIDIPDNVTSTVYGFNNLTIRDKYKNTTEFDSRAKFGNRYFNISGKYTPNVYYVSEYTNYVYYHPSDEWMLYDLFKGQRLIGGPYGDQFVFRLNGWKHMVPMHYVSTTPVYGNSYTMATSNVRNANTNKVIGTLRLGSNVYGVDKGSWTHFTYNGVPAKVNTSLLEYKKIEVYYIEGANIRNQKFEVVGYKSKGSYVHGFILGNYVRFAENGNVRFVHKSLTETTPIFGNAYITSTANIRNYRNEIIKTYKRGTYIGGFYQDGYVHFASPDHYDCIVHASLVKFEDPKTRTVRATANVRNQDLKVVGTKKAGQKIYSVRIGDYYRFYENGVKFIHHSLVK
ncbi:MAG: hypothetical protein GXY87_03210, partial [Tissierellia bacterium]|nr:hypothetical protein [Tissierellia bacterium]